MKEFSDVPRNETAKRRRKWIFRYLLGHFITNREINLLRLKLKFFFSYQLVILKSSRKKWKFMVLIDEWINSWMSSFKSKSLAN